MCQSPKPCFREVHSCRNQDLMAGTTILVQQSPRMYYNESSAPRYSRNPLAGRDSNLESTSTFKRDSSLSQSFQLWGKAKPDASRTDSTDQILSSSFFNRLQPNSSSFKTSKDLELSRKELKIKQLRKEINNDENDHRPQQNRLSQHSKASRATTLKTNYYKNQKIQTQSSFTELKEESMFSPKILKKSKSLVRKVDVSTLLFQDAKRRQEKEQLMIQSDRKQKQLLMSPKINSNTNVLVLNKIRNEFRELVTEEELNPLIALSVLEELFNVSLNPHKQSNQSVQRLIRLLTEDNCYGQATRDRLWQFICIVITGQPQSNVFTKEEEKQIKENYQYLYKQRVTKERRTPSPQQPTFRPKTLQSSSKLAHSFREKTCLKVDDFVKAQKINLNLKKGTYAIEDLFLLQHHRKIAQNQQKKRQKEIKELKLCTFKPDLSPSTSTQPKARQKPKISLRGKPQQGTTQCTLSGKSDNRKLGFSKKSVLGDKNEGWGKGDCSELLHSYQSLV